MQVQNPVFAPPPHVASYEHIEPCSSLPYTFTGTKSPVKYHFISGNCAFSNLLATSRQPKSTTGTFQIGGRTINGNRELEEYIGQLYERARGMVHFFHIFVIPNADKQDRLDQRIYRNESLTAKCFPSILPRFLRRRPRFLNWPQHK